MSYINTHIVGYKLQHRKMFGPCAQKTALIATLFLILAVAPLRAQDQKIGFIDSDVILQNMPEYSGIEQQLQLLSENWREEISELESEVRELEEDFEAREILFTDEIRRERLAEIDQKNRQLENFVDEKFGPSGEYFTRQQELLEPIQRSIFNALNQVASRDGFDFVFDRAEDIRFLYTREQWNLTEDVMLELGIDNERN
ncbi:MAG TPA: OmpH family outer membrane protein [Balneolaceae bacterium]|nr:OmpH family outer membrane protein [Balneolaceae bacterium]